jgi:hypothetical protein
MPIGHHLPVHPATEWQNGLRLLPIIVRALPGLSGRAPLKNHHGATPSYWLKSGDAAGYPADNPHRIV